MIGRRACLEASECRQDWGSCEPMPCGPPQRQRRRWGSEHIRNFISRLGRTSQAPRFGGARCDGNATQKGNCTIPEPQFDNGLGLRFEQGCQDHRVRCERQARDEYYHSKPHHHHNHRENNDDASLATKALTCAEFRCRVKALGAQPVSLEGFPDIAVTTVGLNADSAAAAASAAASVTVEGVETLALCQHCGSFI